MQVYKKMYLTMANAVEKAVEHLMRREVEDALNLLVQAKQDCEDIYIEAEEEP